MSHFKLKLFQALLEQEEPYFIQVFSSQGSVEFIYRDRELRLLTERTSTGSWQDIILADDATYHLRPGVLPSASDGELIPATSIAPVMASPMTSPPPSPPAKPAETPRPAKPVILQGDAALNDMKTSIYGRSTIALDVDLIKSLSKEVLPKSKPAIAIPINPNRTEPFWIGRSKECDLVIEENSVSRKHCQIDFRKGLIQLKDNNSSNGCYVNGGKVTQSVIDPGQKFFVGKVACSVKLTAD